MSQFKIARNHFQHQTVVYGGLNRKRLGYSVDTFCISSGDSVMPALKNMSQIRKFMYSTQQHINDPNQYASPAAALLKDMYSQLRARVFKGNSFCLIL